MTVRTRIYRLRPTQILLVGIVSLWSLTGFAQSIELQAITDFPIIDSGAAPYYKDIAGERNVLAINAANENYREVFARADHPFAGADGIYTVTIRALGEIDGDCEYRLLVNGVVVGSGTNPAVDEDYTVVEHKFEGINLNTNDVLSVESNALSNGLIPEGDGFAFARGRWRSVLLEPQSDSSVDTTNNIDLQLETALDSTELSVGVPASLSLTVSNADAVAVASNGMIESTLPDTLSFFNSDSCQAQGQNISCALPELSANQNHTVSLAVIALNEGSSSITFTTSADQVDNNTEDNESTVELQFAAVNENSTTENSATENTTTENSNTGNSTSGAETTDESNVETQTPNTDASNESSAASNVSKSRGGAASYYWLLLGFVLAWRAKRTIAG